MDKDLRLYKIGSKVLVDLNRVEDRISPSLLEILRINPQGQVMGYKITDGMGIGVVLQLSDKSRSWFFKAELLATSDDEFEDSLPIESSDEIVRNSLVEIKAEKEFVYKQSSKFSFENNSNIFFLMNPLNFFRWFIFSTKDVF